MPSSDTPGTKVTCLQWAQEESVDNILEYCKKNDYLPYRELDKEAQSKLDNLRIKLIEKTKTYGHDAIGVASITLDIADFYMAHYPKSYDSYPSFYKEKKIKERATEFAEKDAKAIWDGIQSMYKLEKGDDAVIER